MYLTATNLAHYVVERGLIEVARIVDGDFTVVEAGRHNRNFKVLQQRGSGLFLKQVKELSEHAKKSLKNEAQCYQLASRYSSISQLTPRLVDYDEHRHCLTMELFHSSQNLREHYLRSDQFSPQIGSAIGVAIAGYHREFPKSAWNDDEAALFKQRLPWIFTYHLKSRFPANSLSGGALELGELIRSLPDLQWHLARLRTEWRYDSLIHGDLKWDNFLIPTNLENLGHGLKIIDWEIVDFGDACWDVGAVLQSYLSHWIFRTLQDQSVAVQDLLDQTKHRMPEMMPLISAFWKSYATGREFDSDSGQMFLVRSVEHAAARMLQTAFESLFNQSKLTPQAIAMVYLSQHILRASEAAVSTFFGLSLENS